MSETSTEPGRRFHPAPWSNGLIGISVLATGVCAGVGFFLAIHESPAARLGVWLLVWIVAWALLHTVRGYEVSHAGIRVRRLFWWSRVPLDGLVCATVDPGAMRGSFRVLGNGGFFAFTGRFHNERLGSFRAYVTDPSRAVVLRFADRIMVVSPADPEAFVRDIEAVRSR